MIRKKGRGTAISFDSLTWAGVEGEVENHPLLITFREIPKIFPKAKYPWRLNIFWRMSEQDENGLPTEQEFNRIGVFEERLLPAVEDDEQSILVSTLTAQGEREYVFHTGDVPVFMERLINMPQEQDRYPITIQKNYDSSWSYFESVIPTE